MWAAVTPVLEICTCIIYIQIYIYICSLLCSSLRTYGSMLFQNFNFVFVSHYIRRKGIKASAHPKRSPTFGFLTLFCTYFRFYLPASRFTSFTFTLRPSARACVCVCVLNCSYFFIVVYCSFVVPTYIGWSSHFLRLLRSI